MIFELIKIIDLMITICILLLQLEEELYFTLHPACVKSVKIGGVIWSDAHIVAVIEVTTSHREAVFVRFIHPQPKDNIIITQSKLNYGYR